MNHSQHDLDLIASYATGDMSERAQAEALMASCTECAAEYREQVAIRQLLGGLGVAPLTTDEAARLQAAVWSRLPAPVTDLSTRTARKPLSPVWGRLTAVAAVLAGVVLVGSVLVRSGGGDATFTTLAAELNAGESSAERASATTIAATETTTDATVQEDAGVMLALDNSLDSLGIRAQELLAQVKSGNTPTTAAPAADAASCREVDDATVLARTEASLEQRQALIVIVQGETEPEARAFYTDDCSEIDLP
ncbi:hypothetical protein BH18ACT5_BH18ACT5_01100 [soil metagenome]